MMLKRPLMMAQNEAVKKEAPKKRKIQPIFLGALTVGSNNLNPPPQQASNFPPSTSAKITLGNSNPNPPKHESNYCQPLTFTKVALDSNNLNPPKHESNFPPPTSKTTTSLAELQKLAAALRVNPVLNGRIDSSQQNGIVGEASNSLPSPESPDLECLDDSSSMASTSTGITAETGGKQQRDRSLPELKDRAIASVELRPLPQILNLQNIAKVALPLPQIQKLIVHPGAMCQVDQIIIMNALINKKDVKSAKIQAKFGRQCRWTQQIGSPLLLVQSNRDWMVSTHEDNSLMVFCTRTGKLSFSLHTDWPIAQLELRGEICLAISVQADLYTWDLKKVRRILHCSIRTLLLGYQAGTHQIVQASLSTKGIPVLVLDSGDVFVHSRSLQSWLCLNLKRNFLLYRLPAFKFIADTYPNGFVALLGEAMETGKLDGCCNQRVNVQLGMEMDATSEEAQLELLLRVVAELDSSEEYCLLAGMYFQKLLAQGKLDKLTEFLDELRRTDQIAPVSAERLLVDNKALWAMYGLTADALISRCEATTDEQRREQELERSLAALLA